MIGGRAFYARFLAMSIGPALLIAFSLGCATVAHSLRGHPMSLSDVRKATISVTVLVTYLVVPAVTTTIVRVFPCSEYDDPNGGDDPVRYLQADLSISCDSPKHRAYRSFAILMLAVWPVGVPSRTGSSSTGCATS